MEVANKATRINLFDFKSVQMRTFHLTWFAFFLCFFGWFGIAPLMAVVREDLLLTKAQIGNTIIASVAITVMVRLLIGPLCDKFGPRKTYSALLVLGSFPVMLIGLADSYESFLLFRLGIGAIGAAFVITQYHTSVMFASNVVGTANATTAGWGNLGGGVTQLVMPLVFAAVMTFGVSEAAGWRVAMIVPGVVLFIMGIVYYLFTQDAPDGNYSDLRAAGKLPPATKERSASGSFLLAARDYRVWALFVVYAACFGVELTINNIAAIYYFDNFSLDLKTAGMIAALFGLMNLFARTLGGYFSDRFALKSGLSGRVRFLFIVLFCEGLALMLFSQMDVLILAVGSMIMFSLFVQMSEGATFGIVPFMNRKALGAVAGIVGAGGNAGAVAAGFLFKAESISYQQGLFYLGLAVIGASFCALLVRFSDETHAEEKARLNQDLLAREPASAT
ncbi:major facilitator superfamily transporter [Oceanococcus atlanticus]|uniref:Major facilitator superfamily transporter n=1 Tax=Oceanococcus atlanticus TaxID=1317117 RepID=A0A1Y1SDW2_9GAMM|nr:MFS transporter [Oceanococcus atlanticus]ORE87195.1 major facilitator superfamily transporter [Oceanococcus atlanticus]